MHIFKPTPARPNAFAEFIRNASARDKKRVYEGVKRATERQKALAPGEATSSG